MVRRRGLRGPAPLLPHPRAVNITPRDVWSLILAGGDGTRLGGLTRQITGDARPKQFCPLLDGDTLLERTRRRVDLLTRFDRQVIVVTRQHACFYRHLAGDLAPGRLVEQPANRGTAPGILYPLLRIAELGGDVPVAVLPSDQFVDDDVAFVAAVSAAVDAVQARPDLIVLLGIQASTPETEYGWIELEERPLALPGEPVFPVRQFREKPTRAVAEILLARGCLWNSFVMVGRPRAFLDLYRANAPELLRAFQPVLDTLGTAREATVAERVYAALSPVDFSQRLLAAGTRLGVVRLKGVAWSDLGTVERLAATLRHTGVRPRWLDALRLPG
jgi:mannose-1-phosphate guanylyltransferase